MGVALLDLKDARHRDVVLDRVELRIHGGDESATVKLDDGGLLVIS
jgi:hypothetical protein